MNNRTAYVENMKAKLDEWNLELDKLSAKANEAKADVQLAYREHIATLSQRRDEAGQKLKELAAASDDAWDDVRQGVESAWRKMSHAFSDASERFKS